MGRRGTKFDKSVYYDFGPVFSRNGVYNFIAGGRGIGKTYGAKKMAIRNFLRYGDQFIYLRRYKTELSTVKTFFADIAQEFPDYGFRVNGLQLEITDEPLEEKPKWQVMGFVVALSNSQARKSVSYPNVTLIIFDEFIIEKGALHYLPSEDIVFTNFYSTVDRGNDRVRVLFLANAVSIMNPYFTAYKIEPEPDKEWLSRYDGFIVAHFPKSTDYAAAVKKTRFGRFIAGSDYEKYAVGNMFADNSASLIAPKTPEADYWFSLDVEGGRVSIWRDALNYPQLHFFVQEKCPKKEIIRTFDPERMGEGKVLINWNDRTAQFLRTAFRYGRVEFDSPTTRNKFVQAFKKR